MDITRHNKPQRKHAAPRAPDDTYRITEVYYDTHEEAKNTLRSIVTPIVCPRTWAENGDVAVTTTAVCTSTTTHRRSQKNTPRVDCDTEPTTSYLQQRELGLLIFIEETRFCGHDPLCAVKTLLYENQQP